MILSVIFVFYNLSMMIFYLYVKFLIATADTFIMVAFKPSEVKQAWPFFCLLTNDNELL